jgi:hypothetical protein
MIVCTKCGTHNADDQAWCTGCRTFLEWDGERVTAPTPPQGVPVVPVEPEQPRRGIIRRIKAAIGTDDKHSRDGFGRME